MNRALFCIFTICVFLVSVSAVAQTKPARVVGLVHDGPKANAALEAQIRTEIVELTKSDFDVSFKVIDGDWTAAGAQKAVDQAQADTEIQFVIATGVLGSAVLANTTKFDKPTIALVVIDPKLQGFKVKGGKSGVPNFTYFTLPYGFVDGVDDFRNYWKFKTLGVIAQPEITKASPKLVEGLQKQLEKNGIKLVAIQGSNDFQSMLNAVPTEVDAIYIGALDQLSDEEFGLLLKGLHQRRLPTFAHRGLVDVERGALMGAAPQSDMTKMARGVALAVLGGLNRERLENVPIGFQTAPPRLVINVEVARQIGFSPTFALLSEAELVGGTVDPEGQLTLTKATKMAIESNPELMAQTEVVRASSYDVDRAWTAYYPSLDVYLSGQVTRDKAAELNFGVSEFQAVVGGRLEQLIYNEDASAGIGINEPLQESRVFQLEGARLDVYQNVAQAYVNVLRAQTRERVARDNLAVTQSNLELAELRVSIGVSNPSDVYRWQTQIAGAQSSVLQAAAQVDQAKSVLGQIIGGESKTLQLAELDEDPTIGDLAGRVTDYVDDPQDLALFVDFLTQEAMQNAPELDEIGKQVQAQERIRDRSTRAWFLPTAGIAADMNYVFARGGAGTESAIPGIEVLDFYWTAEAFLRLPILEQGTRVADEDQANASIIALENQRRAIETRIRQSIELASADLRVSQANIEITGRAFEAAKKNLELVTDNYTRGTANVIVLTDAQSLAFRSEQAAEDARYQHLFDLVALLRTLGRIGLGANQANSDWINRFESYRAEQLRQRRETHQ